MTGVTTSQLYVNKKYNYGNVIIQETPTGLLPAFKVEYQDGSKYLVLVPRANFFSFESEEIQFVLEQYMWNNKFERWDMTDSKKFNNNMITISNRFIVNAATGQSKDEMTTVEQVGKTFVGEYQFWLDNLGKSIILPQLLNAIKKKFEFEPVVTPEPVVVPEPPTSGSTQP